MPETQPYDPEAIFDENGPLDPTVMDEAVYTIMRAIEPDLADTPAATGRRMYAAMRALASLHPRSHPELMLGVQAICAYHAATAAWRAATQRRTGDQSRHHIATAATAARTFDTMLRALERRQAKPLSVPAGRPPPRTWPPVDLDAIQTAWNRRCGLQDGDLTPDMTGQKSMTDDELVSAWAAKAQQWRLNPNEGLDIVNTDGILPGGGMIVPWNPTKQQIAYMERRLILRYVQEQAENRRRGSSAPIQLRPIRTGDLIS